MEQQTAVEWLHLKLKEWANLHSGFDILFEQAKIWDKQEKQYFFNCGRQYQLTGEGTFTQVYNETYKSEQPKSE